jgi:hypothetical protein
MQAKPSARPRKGLTPVQFAPAVIRKATAIVATNPHIISCACQNTPFSTPFKRAGEKIQIATDRATQAAAPR